MPANLPPQYYLLEREFRTERDQREKLRLGQELLAMMPKHKGTDKLQAELKAKISKLNKQLQSGIKSHGARQLHTHDHIDKEGARQIILIGPPNSGKSSLVDILTHARPVVADYPYSTREPLAGMMTYENIQLQLIDTPPISPESFEPYIANLVRQADLVVLVADLSDPQGSERVRFVINSLEAKRVLLRPAAEKTGDPTIIVKPTVICAHKEYEDVSGANFSRLKSEFADFRIILTSILDDDALNRFKGLLFEELHIIRVYTKHSGEQADMSDPVVLSEGGTIEQAALSIHKDFAAKLKYARIWGKGKFDAQRVTRDYSLLDGDIVEFHV